MAGPEQVQPEAAILEEVRSAARTLVEEETADPMRPSMASAVKAVKTGSSPSRFLIFHLSRSPCRRPLR
jgi:hypothetical protein